MTIQTKIDNFIAQNNWVSLEIFLASEKGFIHQLLGGRYCSGPYIEIDGYADINKICWSVLRADLRQLSNKLPNDQLLAASNVIKELRRLYDESETALENAPYSARVATRIYDFVEKTYYDGFQPIDRLEEGVLPNLESLTSIV